MARPTIRCGHRQKETPGGKRVAGPFWFTTQVQDRFDAVIMKTKILLYILLSAAASTLVVGAWMYNKPHLAVWNQEADIKVSAAELVSAFSRDEGAANSLYAGKVLEVEGVVSEIISDEHATILMLGEDSRASGISCYLQQNATDRYSALAAGRTVTVKGICNGMLMDVVLDKCVVVSAAE